MAVESYCASLTFSQKCGSGLFFWHVTLCQWVICPWHWEGRQSIQLKGYRGPRPMKMKTICYFGTSGTSYLSSDTPSYPRRLESSSLVITQHSEILHVEFCFYMSWTFWCTTLKFSSTVLLSGDHQCSLIPHQPEYVILMSSISPGVGNILCFVFVSLLLHCNTRLFRVKGPLIFSQQ